MDSKRRKYFRGYIKPKRLKMTEEPEEEIDKNNDKIGTDNEEINLNNITVEEKELNIFKEIERLHDLEKNEGYEEDLVKIHSLSSNDENEAEIFEVSSEFLEVSKANKDCERLKDDLIVLQQTNVHELHGLNNKNQFERNKKVETFNEYVNKEYQILSEIEISDTQSYENAVERYDNSIQIANNGEEEKQMTEVVKELNDSELVQLKCKNKETTFNEDIPNNSQIPENAHYLEHHEILVDDSTAKGSTGIIEATDNDITMDTGNENDIQYENEAQKEKNYKKKYNYSETKMLRQIQRQKYVDFLSDDEDFVWSSSSWEGSDVETTEDEELKERKKKKKEMNKSKKKTLKVENVTKDIDKETTEETISTKKKRINKRKVNKLKKAFGEEYATLKGKVVAAKQMRPNPCTKDKCNNECYEINEDRRLQIFKYFWSLDTIRRKDWLVSNCKKNTVQRKRSSELSRRGATFNYFINEGEGRKQVCLKFLTSTLDLNQKTVYNIVNSAVYGSAKDDSRGKHVPANKTSSETINSVRRYIQNLPALPSHYCRKNTTRTYLPTEFKNITNLYRLYREKQEKDGIDFVGEKVFKKVFYDEFNLGFHVPRKDKCTKCVEFENKQDNDSEERKQHLKDKEETYERFKNHQVIHEKDSSILCTSFDLQKVLNTPHGESMLLYYSRKLAVYNLTFYESGTKNGYCYTWSEVDGKRGANEVSSILRKYILKVDELGSIKHLLLYCDSCPGQNKNKIILACINETLNECHNLMSIQINYLLPGHTYMPVDSMHSVIEKSVNGVIIWAPSQWPTVFCLARKLPKAYEVKSLTHADFDKWDAITDKYFKGNLTGKISKIRIVTFKKSHLDKIFVKYTMNPDEKAEEIDVLGRNIITQLKPCYKAMLPVSKKKYADLIKLCTNHTIPLMYHQEYKNIPSANNVQDTLKETDVEDNED